MNIIRVSRVKQLFGETVIYGVSSVLTRFINLLLLPLYTNILSPGEYGVLNILSTTFSLLWLVSVLALDSASFVFFHDFKEEDERKKVFSSWFWLQLVFGAVLFLIVFSLSNILSDLFFSSEKHGVEFRLIAFLLVLNILPNLVWNWLRVKRRVKTTAVFSVIQSVIIIGFNVWFILGLRMGIKGFFLAQIISGVLMSVVAFVLLRESLSLQFFNKQLLKNMLIYSLPLVPTAVAAWGLNSSGGYFIQAQLGSVEVGLYQTGLTLSGILSFVTMSFTQAWGPFAMSIKDQKDSSAFFAKIFLIYISFIGVLAAGVLIFSSDILAFVTSPDYAGADWVAGLLSFNALLIGLNYIASLGLNFSKDMRPFALASIIGSLVNLGLFYFGASFFGKEGCAIASLISNTGISFFIFRAAQIRYPIPFNFLKGILLFSICFFGAIFIKILNTNIPYNSLLVRVLGFTVVISILFLLNKREFFVVLKKIKISKSN